MVAVLTPHAADAAARLMNRLCGRSPRFICVIASTDTALIPGISAAGASPELIPLTPAADAEIVVHGRARCIAGVPSNPLGPPGPALITRAAVELAGMDPLFVDAGCAVRPDVPCVDLCGRPGGLISNGHAVPDAQRLYEAGLDLGAHLWADADYVVLGESVPGGTTTALALLLALGIAAEGRVSSSMAHNAHDLKNTVAREALAHLDRSGAARDPLLAVETVGDPMQAATAGIAAALFARGIPVLLAGGTQMVAVLALLHALARVGRGPQPSAGVAVATTRWVVGDPTADIVGLLSEVGNNPLLATPLSFARSVHPSLRLYETYLVKEGVGAGGCCVAAHLSAGASCEQIVARVDELYAEISAEAVRRPVPEDPR